jgi:hypothetical protein
LRRIPIFDTNIFGHVQSGKIPESDWRFLLSRRPVHGWPLSSVMALELLAELDDVSFERYAEFRERIKLASRLSNGFVPRRTEVPNMPGCPESPLPA